MHYIKIRKYCTRAILLLSLSLQATATNVLLIDPKKDGDCGFEAIALQRQILGFNETAKSLRKTLAKSYQARYDLTHDEDMKIFLSDRLVSENALRERANKDQLPDIVSLLKEIKKPAAPDFTPIFMSIDDITILANTLNFSIDIYLKEQKKQLSSNEGKTLLNLCLSNNHFQCFVMDNNSLPDKTVLAKLIRQQQALDPNAEDIKNIKALTDIGSEIQTRDDITHYLIDFENQMKNINLDMTNKVSMIINNYNSSNDIELVRKEISNIIEDIENGYARNYKQRAQLYREDGSFIDYSQMGINEFYNQYANILKENINIEVLEDNLNSKSEQKEDGNNLDETFRVNAESRIAEEDDNLDETFRVDAGSHIAEEDAQDGNTFRVDIDVTIEEADTQDGAPDLASMHDSQADAASMHSATESEAQINDNIENTEESNNTIIISTNSDSPLGSANNKVHTLFILLRHSNSQDNLHDKSTASSAEDINEILGGDIILGSNEPVLSLAKVLTNPKSLINSTLKISPYNINKLSPLLIKKWHGALMSQHITTLQENHVNIANRMANASQLRQGVGASEDYNNNSMGLWIRSNYGFGSSKITESNLPYEANNQYNTNNIGATIGLDFGQAHDKMLGLAYSHNTGNINYKANKANKAKDKLQTNLFSLYGLYYVNNPLHVNALLSYGISTVTKEKFENLSTPLSGKVKMFDALISLGYDFVLAERLAFVPSIGFEYLNYNQDKLSDTKKIHSLDAVTMNKLRLVTELSITYASNFENLAMHFDVHGKFYQDLNNKVKISTPNTPIVMESSNDVILPRSNFNLGASLVLDFQDNVNLGIGYDYYANKDLNYTSVFLKAKLSF